MTSTQIILAAIAAVLGFNVAIVLAALHRARCIAQHPLPQSPEASLTLSGGDVGDVHNIVGDNDAAA